MYWIKCQPARRRVNHQTNLWRVPQFGELDRIQNVTNYPAISLMAQTHGVANASLSAIGVLNHVTLACGSD